MKRIFLLILILYNITFAYEFKLNKDDIKYIQESKKQSFIVNRLKKYKTLKEEVVDYTLIRKLSHINAFFNKILPKHDIKANSSIDYWATPKEFLIQGHGDCEDYVISKYFTLLELGIKKKNLYFAVVKVKGERDYHMVLLYVEDKKKSPLVLDNLSFKVIPFNKRKKLIPQFAFNEIDAYKFTKDGFTKKVKINWGNENKWQKLLIRVYEKNE
ncbi:transglutaminase-like cysteine peptidase [Malaciobacter sp. WC5094]|uniref:transglutaminase-like cysteine peptidase n=1 Tax=Arcobacter sp. YIC-80 TaxID=3376683 RepID=UPI00384EE020